MQAIHNMDLIENSPWLVVSKSKDIAVALIFENYL